MIRSRQITPLVPSAEYTGDTEVLVDINDLGISRGQTVVGCFLLVEVTANTNTDDVKLAYYGPTFRKSDGTVVKSNTIVEVRTFSGGSLGNSFLIPTDGTTGSMFPVTGSAGMRLYVFSSSWDGTFTAEINAFLLVTD